MKIVILDGYTINPGDLSWSPIQDLGDCEIHDRTSADQVYNRVKDADICITSKVFFNAELMNRLNKLKYIGVIATGYNVIDLETARKRDILITNIPNYCTQSVVQNVFGHILELCHRIGHHDLSVKSGKWSQSRDFCYWDYPQVELANKILGIIGCGNIGQAVAGIALQFGMKVIIYDLCRRDLGDLDAELVDLDTLFHRSDIISLHCPLTPETKGLVNMETIAKMKKSVYIINAARGPLINEADLVKALNEGLIAGAGLDVLEVEPPHLNNPLFKAKNCFITPHIAWASIGARERLIQFTADNIKAYLAGNPQNVVN